MSRTWELAACPRKSLEACFARGPLQCSQAQTRPLCALVPKENVLITHSFSGLPTVKYALLIQFTAIVTWLSKFKEAFKCNHALCHVLGMNSPPKACVWEVGLQNVDAVIESPGDIGLCLLLNAVLGP